MYICPTLTLDLPNPGAEARNVVCSFDPGSDPDLFQELRLEGTMVGRFILAPVGRESFRIEGGIEGRRTLVCSRSLEEFSHPFQVRILADIDRVAGVAVQEVSDDESDEEAFQIRLPPGQTWVDLAECVRQLVILEEPINPVKEPEAEFHWESGERNEAPEVDPRWAKLNEWKQKHSKE